MHSSSRINRVDIDLESSGQTQVKTIQNDPEEELDSVLEDQERTMTLIGFIANTTNSVIGAGILALPYTFATVGYGTGIILLLFGAIVTWFGLHLLCRVAHRIGVETKDDNLSFGSVAEKVSVYLPPLASFLTMVNCFVMTVAYLNTFAKYMIKVVAFFAVDAPDDAWFLQRVTYLLVGFAIAAPLSFPEKISVLQYTSSIAVIMVFYTTILVVVYAFRPIDILCSTFLDDNNATSCFGDRCCVDSGACCIGTVQSFTSDPIDLIRTFPTMVTAFCCAAQIFALYNGLRRPSMKRLNVGTASSIMLCFTIYIIIALGGYLTYGNTISDDLLSSYPLSAEVTVARLGIAMVLAFSYPLFAQVARDSLVLLVSQPFANRHRLADKHSKEGRILFYSCAFVVVAASFFMSLANISLSILLNFVGTVCVVNLSFTFPGIFFWVVFRDIGKAPSRLAAPALGAFGVIIMIFNIVLWGMGYM